VFHQWCKGPYVIRKLLVFSVVIFLSVCAYFFYSRDSILDCSGEGGIPSVVSGNTPRSLELPTGLIISEPASDLIGADFGFRFVRIKYSQSGFRRGWRGTPTWAYDYPTAELNLHTALERTTKIRILGQPIVLTLSDKRIFEHPVLYLTEPGFWETNDEEIENMRSYLARGGFLIIDDFHDYGGKGYQWFNMFNNIKRVFPDREPEPLEPDHQVWSIYYDIDPVEAQSTKPGFGRYDDEYYAIYDDSGRMMCVICYNQDIGDGWEWPNRNLAGASTVSFQMAVNFIMYAFTH